MAEAIIQDVQLSFPTLWKAEEFKTGDGRPRFSATFLVEPGSENDKKIKAAIEEEGKATFGDKWPQIHASMKGQKNQYCYLDGNTRPYEGYKDKMALSCHRREQDGRPIIMDRNKAPLTQDDRKPYAGCFVNAKVSVYAQKGENPGIRASFSVIQFVRDGEAFSGSAPNADGFEDLGAAEEADIFG